MTKNSEIGYRIWATAELLRYSTTQAERVKLELELRNLKSQVQE